MLLTDEQVKDTAHSAAKNPTQALVAEKAIRDALSLVDDQSVAQLVPDVVSASPCIPLTAVSICVVSADVVAQRKPAGDPDERNAIAQIYPRLDTALAEYGPVELVTFGNRGAEPIAAKWARQRGVTHREFGVAWVQRLPDGTTQQVSRARDLRRDAVRAYLAASEIAFLVQFGEPSDTRGFRRMQQISKMLIEAGAGPSSERIAAFLADRRTLAEDNDVTGEQ